MDNNLFNSPKILWEECSSIFLDKNTYPEIPGAWKLMLLGDGSPTRHLQLLTKKETKIELIGMNYDKESSKKPPKEIDQLTKPLIRRQVWIKNNDITLAWAESWWNNEAVNMNLPNKKNLYGKTLQKIVLSYLEKLMLSPL